MPEPHRDSNALRCLRCIYFMVRKMKNIHSNERSDVVSSPPQKTSRSGLYFLPGSVGAFWSVKKKKLFERSEFFFFSGKKYRSRQKNADGEFSFCFVFLLFGQKKNEKTPFWKKKNHFFHLFLKKIPKTFGGFKNTTYLCTRFRKGSEF